MSKVQKPNQIRQHVFTSSDGARAFAKWGIDFVGPIDPLAYRTQDQYIIVATNYLTKWVEARATQQQNDARTTTKFLDEKIFMRYGLPIELISD